MRHAIRCGVFFDSRNHRPDAWGLWRLNPARLESNRWMSIIFADDARVRRGDVRGLDAHRTAQARWHYFLAQLLWAAVERHVDRDRDAAEEKASKHTGLRQYSSDKKRFRR